MRESQIILAKISNGDADQSDSTLSLGISLPAGAAIPADTDCRKSSVPPDQLFSAWPAVFDPDELRLKNGR